MPGRSCQGPYGPDGPGPTPFFLAAPTPPTPSLLHINIHPLRRNSLDANRNRPSSDRAIFAAPAQCFSAFSLQVTTNPSILCAPAQCFRAGAPPLSLLHINIHPLRRNSFDADRNRASAAAQASIILPGYGIPQHVPCQAMAAPPIGLKKRLRREFQWELLCHVP